MINLTEAFQKALKGQGTNVEKIKFFFGTRGLMNILLTVNEEEFMRSPNDVGADKSSLSCVLSVVSMRGGGGGGMRGVGCCPDCTRCPDCFRTS